MTRHTDITYIVAHEGSNCPYDFVTSLLNWVVDFLAN
jgi:hypothetical protein